MQFNIKPEAANILKKPSDLAENQPAEIAFIHTSASGNGIACYCPDCGAEIEFNSDWPIDIPITCGNVQDKNDVCKCRFIIRDHVAIED